MTCIEDGCNQPVKARSMCRMHYNAAWYQHRHNGLDWGTTHQSVDRFVNPLVCVCLIPQADLRINFGECAICRRKPLALMAVRSTAKAA